MLFSEFESAPLASETPEDGVPDVSPPKWGDAASSNNLSQGKSTRNTMSAPGMAILRTGVPPATANFARFLGFSNTPLHCNIDDSNATLTAAPSWTSRAAVRCSQIAEHVDGVRPGVDYLLAIEKKGKTAIGKCLM